MTLDEAISHFRHTVYCLRNDNTIKQFGNCIESYEQLTKWLEELKAIKSNGRYVQGNKAGQKIGYNKAIDDYMNKLCNHCMQQTNECYKLECPFCTDGCDIVNIAEQLKATVKVVAEL